MRKWGWILAAALLLCGCAGQAEPETQPPQTIPVHTVPAAVETEAAVLMQAPPPPVGVVLEPEHPGTLEDRSENVVIDYSRREDGYIMACFLTETPKRLKLRIQGSSTTYTYNLPPQEWTAFPLSDGDGTYRAAVYQNTTGNKYATMLTAEFEVQLKDEFAPFLRPNQYVDYTCAPNTVQTGALLCEGLTHPLEKVAAVYDYVVGSLTYDEEKAANVKSGYLPVLDQVLAEKKGICFDYAALMTAMLRSQQVPCKLVVGYAGSVYHAWISVWTEEEGWIDAVVHFDGKSWKRMDPTFASSGERSQEIMDFIEHGSYTVKYLY